MRYRIYKLIQPAIYRNDEDCTAKKAGGIYAVSDAPGLFMTARLRIDFKNKMVRCLSGLIIHRVQPGFPVAGADVLIGDEGSKIHNPADNQGLG